MPPDPALGRPLQAPSGEARLRAPQGVRDPARRRPRDRGRDRRERRRLLRDDGTRLDPARRRRPRVLPLRAGPRDPVGRAGSEHVRASRRELRVRPLDAGDVLEHDAMLLRSAAKAALWCWTFGIPRRWLTVTQLREGRRDSAGTRTPRARSRHATRIPIPAPGSRATCTSATSATSTPTSAPRGLSPRLSECRIAQPGAAVRATSPRSAASSCGRDHIGQWLVGRSTQVRSRSSAKPPSHA